MLTRCVAPVNVIVPPLGCKFEIGLWYGPKSLARRFQLTDRPKGEIRDDNLGHCHVDLELDA